MDINALRALKVGDIVIHRKSGKRYAVSTVHPNGFVAVMRCDESGVIARDVQGCHWLGGSRKMGDWVAA
jgi:hypothetical protein